MSYLSPRAIHFLSIHVVDVLSTHGVTLDTEDVAAALHNPQRITTGAGLLELPIGQIVLDDDDEVIRKIDTQVWENLENPPGPLGYVLTLPVTLIA